LQGLPAAFSRANGFIGQLCAAGLSGEPHAGQEYRDHGASLSQSTSSTEKCKRLFELVSPEDTVAILINADPDAIASALALKDSSGAKVKKTFIYNINIIKRADNLALIRLLKIELQSIPSSRVRKSNGPS
jgi:hypothetical protein